jgi:hypothetical protein
MNNLRLLHIALRTPADPQAALARALQSLTYGGGDYAEVEWCHSPHDAPARAVAEARRIGATTCLLQIQTPGVFRPEDILALRSACAPGAVLMQFDGDHRHDHVHGRDRDWFRDLARVLDASFVVCTRDVEEYTAQGIPGVQFWNIGVDADLWRPCAPAPGTPPLVMLASDYASVLPAYERRVDICRKLTATYPGSFAVYGHGWVRHDVASRPFLQHAQEAPVLSAARAVLSMSIRNDLPHYTSDRLFRCLAAGALTLVEEFPGYQDLGVKHGVNALVFRDWDSLKPLVDSILSPGGYPRAAEIRAAARELALTHTWEARMVELAALVATIRSRRNS